VSSIHIVLVNAMHSRMIYQLEYSISLNTLLA